MLYACSYCASYSQILNCVCVCVCVGSFLSSLLFLSSMDILSEINFMMMMMIESCRSRPPAQTVKWTIIFAHQILWRSKVPFKRYVVPKSKIRPILQINSRLRVKYIHNYPNSNCAFWKVDTIHIMSPIDRFFISLKIRLVSHTIHRSKSQSHVAVLHVCKKYASNHTFWYF